MLQMTRKLVVYTDWTFNTFTVWAVVDYPCTVTVDRAEVIAKRMRWVILNDLRKAGTIDYHPPRWWEFWRWLEETPPRYFRGVSR